MSELTPLSIRSYYVLLLVQRLAVSKSVYTLSDDANTIQSLVALAMQNSKTEEERKMWEETLRALGEITLELTLIEEEIREFREELVHGNILSVPESLLTRYRELAAELRKIEAKVLDNLDNIIGQVGVSPVITMPVGVSSGRKKGRRKKEVVEDDLIEI